MKKTAIKTAKPAKAPAKRVSTPGKFIYTPIVSVIRECGCGNKYIATRKGQKTCLQCMFGN